MMDNELLQLSHLDTMLAQATRIDEITSIRAKLEALRVYAVNIGKSHEETQTIAMARIKAERKAGQVILSLPKRNGARKPDAGFIDAIPQEIGGVKKSQINSWQTIARIPDDLFDGMMLERYQSGEDITTSYFYKAAKIHTMRQRGISTDKPHKPDTTILIDYSQPITVAAQLRAVMADKQIGVLIDALLIRDDTDE